MIERPNTLCKYLIFDWTNLKNSRVYTKNIILDSTSIRNFKNAKGNSLVANVLVHRNMTRSCDYINMISRVDESKVSNTEIVEWRIFISSLLNWHPWSPAGCTVISKACGWSRGKREYYSQSHHCQDLYQVSIVCPLKSVIFWKLMDH